MIQLTARLNERDQSILQLQDELDQYDKQIKLMEDAFDQKTLTIIHLQKLLIKNNIPHDTSAGLVTGLPHDWWKVPGLEQLPLLDDTEVGKMQERLNFLEESRSQSMDNAAAQTRAPELLANKKQLIEVQTVNDKLQKELGERNKEKESLETRIQQLQFEKSLRDKLEVMVQKELSSAALWKKQGQG